MLQISEIAASTNKAHTSMCEHVFSIEHVCLAWFQNGIEKEERRKGHTCVTRTAEFAPPSKHVDYISSRNELQNDAF